MLLLLVGCTAAPPESTSPEKNQPKAQAKTQAAQPTEKTDEQILEELNEYLKHNPIDGEALVKRGDLYEKLGRTDAARDDYKLAREVQPKYPLGWFRFGKFLYNREGNFDEALGNLNRAIEVDPKFPDAFYYRGLVRKDRGQYKKALKDFETALELAQQQQDWPLRPHAAEFARQMSQLPDKDEN